MTRKIKRIKRRRLSHPVTEKVREWIGSILDEAKQNREQFKASFPWLPQVDIRQIPDFSPDLMDEFFNSPDVCAFLVFLIWFDWGGALFNYDLSEGLRFFTRAVKDQLRQRSAIKHDKGGAVPKVETIRAYQCLHEYLRDQGQSLDNFLTIKRSQRAEIWALIWREHSKDICGLSWEKMTRLHTKRNSVQRNVSRLIRKRKEPQPRK